jgi:hypothetical protein
MKEIYKQTPTVLKFAVYLDGVAIDATGNVAVKINSIAVGNATKTPSTTGKYTYSLPSSYLLEEGALDVEWTYTLNSQSYTYAEKYYIVTPYIDWDTFAIKFDQYNQTYSDYLKAEALARHIIEGYCGQKFGKFTETVTIDGTGDDALYLGNRLLAINEINYYDQDTLTVYDDYTWETAADGWIIRRRNEYRPISVTEEYSPRFKRNNIYLIEGIWGWESIPPAVSQAAEILVSSYVCPDVTYRNKYIDNIKSGEWRIQYHEFAWRGTGDANVDLLLKEYRNYPIVGVI